MSTLIDLSEEIMRLALRYPWAFERVLEKLVGEDDIVRIMVSALEGQRSEAERINFYSIHLDLAGDPADIFDAGGDHIVELLEAAVSRVLNYYRGLLGPRLIDSTVIVDKIVCSYYYEDSLLHRLPPNDRSIIDPLRPLIGRNLLSLAALAPAAATLICLESLYRELGTKGINLKGAILFLKPSSFPLILLSTCAEPTKYSEVDAYMNMSLKLEARSPEASIEMVASSLMKFRVLYVLSFKSNKWYPRGGYVVSVKPVKPRIRRSLIRLGYEVGASRA